MEPSITVCLGEACMAAGNQEHFEMVGNYLEGNQVAAKVSCEACQCSGSCTEAPRVVLDGTTPTRVNTTALLDLLEFYYSGEA